jgi:hypothetical protein
MHSTTASVSVCSSGWQVVASSVATVDFDFDFDFDVHFVGSHFLQVFKITGFCLTFINSCINPFALYFLSSQFRKYYNRYLFCCFTRPIYKRMGGQEPSSTMQNFNSTVSVFSVFVVLVFHCLCVLVFNCFSV